MPASSAVGEGGSCKKAGRDEGAGGAEAEAAAEAGGESGIARCWAAALSAERWPLAAVVLLFSLLLLSQRR
jgi:hypothetical protein